MSREIRSFDYVNHPYEVVRNALSADALAVFRSATKAAADRARSVAAELRVNIGAIEVGAEINISVKKIEQTTLEQEMPVTTIDLEWAATTMPGLFPIMRGELAVYPLTATETQLDFLGVYEPPLGAVGKALNAVAGYRVAEATVHRFVGDVAGYLRESLSKR
jgi:hypothetical protein